MSIKGGLDMGAWQYTHWSESDTNVAQSDHPVLVPVLCLLAPEPHAPASPTHPGVWVIEPARMWVRTTQRMVANTPLASRTWMKGAGGGCSSGGWEQQDTPSGRAVRAKAKAGTQLAVAALCVLLYR